MVKWRLDGFLPAKYQFWCSLQFHFFFGSGRMSFSSTIFSHLTLSLYKVCCFICTSVVVIANWTLLFAARPQTPLPGAMLLVAANWQSELVLELKPICHPASATAFWFEDPLGQLVSLFVVTTLPAHFLLVRVPLNSSSFYICRSKSRV